MSPATGNGDQPAVMTGGPPPRQAGAARLPQDLDYRLRGLSAEPDGVIPTTPPRRDLPRRRRRRRGSLLAKMVVLVAVAVLAGWLVQSFVVQPFSVPGTAMSPTLAAGDRILVAKPSLLTGPIHSGQIIVFRSPGFLPCNVAAGAGASNDLVLRVVALPGQTIWSVGSTIFVSGRALSEKGWYNPRFGQLGSTPIPSTTLGASQYYVLGDNRSAACDSRVFGPIAKSSILGEGIALLVRHGHVDLGKL
jgi:signal peptidase I